MPTYEEYERATEPTGMILTRHSWDKLTDGGRQKLMGAVLPRTTLLSPERVIEVCRLLPEIDGVLVAGLGVGLAAPLRSALADMVEALRISDMRADLAEAGTAEVLRENTDLRARLSTLEAANASLRQELAEQADKHKEQLRDVLASLYDDDLHPVSSIIGNDFKAGINHERKLVAELVALKARELSVWPLSQAQPAEIPAAEPWRAVFPTQEAYDASVQSVVERIKSGEAKPIEPEAYGCDRLHIVTLDDYQAGAGFECCYCGAKLPASWPIDRAALPTTGEDAAPETFADEARQWEEGGQYGG